MKTEMRVIDNRVFLLGLDELYREAIKPHERGNLLQCAELVAADLALTPTDDPVEGYYTEDPSLETYFRLVRAIQGQDKMRASEIFHHEAFDRLKTVSESPIFGVPFEAEGEERLLRRARNALHVALQEVGINLSVENITNAAYESASRSDDFALASIAALARDSVVLAALGESIVLYANLEDVFSLEEEVPIVQYEWLVDSVVEARARLFVNEFNRLFDESLPEPCATNAAVYWNACDIDAIAGRCVALGKDRSQKPPIYYHWAVERCENGRFEVFDFWDSDLWTTARFRASPSRIRKGLLKPRTKAKVWRRFWD